MKHNSLFAVAMLLASIICPVVVAAAPVTGAAISGQEGKNYYFIVDYTQGSNLNVVVSNTQLITNQGKQIPPNNWVPLTGFEYPPVAAINPSYWPSNGTTQLTPNLYYQLYGTSGWSDLSQAGLATATDNTCYQNIPGWCPDNQVPQTFVNRLGSYSGGSITPLTNTALSGGSETPASYFNMNDQAFNMDRIRYAANRMWYQWYKDVHEIVKGTTPRTGNWYELSNAYDQSPKNSPYQLTGTMSFENFLDNVVNNRAMYGIVRVVIPVDADPNSPNYGVIYADTKQPIRGAEFDQSGTPYQWAPGSSLHKRESGSSMISSTDLATLVRAWSKAVYNNANPNGGILVYGSLLMDFVAFNTYNPDNFIDDNQDYVDNYSSIALHDSTVQNAINSSNPTMENGILPRTTSQQENMGDDESISVNPTWVNTNNRVSSVDTAQNYMWKGSVTFASNGVDYPDASVWEYWMRKAVMNSPSSSTYTGIINDLASSGQTQYNYQTQQFNSGAARLATFNSTEWSKLSEPNQFHTYFPSGYEHGWMMAFDALWMDALDSQTPTATTGSWWSDLTQTSSTDASGSVALGPNMTGTPFSARSSQNYAPFEVPGSSLDITVDVNGDGHATPMPNFFSTDWEDMPAFYFAGGYLNIEGFANIGGMVYTPDTAFIAPGAGTTAASTGAQEYINGALLAGDGIWIGDKTDNNQLIAVSYNYNSFDRLRHSPILQTNVEDITELRGN